MQQIQNPYLQFFVGLPLSNRAAPFAPSLFVEIRKPDGTIRDEEFWAIIGAIAEEETGRRTARTASRRTILPPAAPEARRRR